MSGGGTTTCSGDPGTFGNDARITNGSTTLIIENLVGNIAPGGGTEGVSIRSLGPDEADPTEDPSSVTLRFNSPNSVTTNGASGIVAISRGGLGDPGTAAVETPSRGGNGGNVTISSDAQVFTTNGAGIYGGSFGGRGGQGGGGQDGRPGGNAGQVTITQNGAVQTNGNNSSGIVAVTNAGDGGNGGSGVIVAIGDGARGGSAGRVEVYSNAAISTNGTDSTGIFARSLGGGGGNGGDGPAFGSSGAGGASSGADVVVNTTNTNIQTIGDRSFGVFAQSVGGYGGTGGTGTILIASFGGDADSGGHGGNVNVNTGAGQINTNGLGASGIFAQSVGGNGGAGGSGFGLIVSLAGSGGQGGWGNNVTIENRANITIQGPQSNGIFAQSVGGGGGTGGVAGGLVAVGGNGGGANNAGVVTVRNFGNMTLSGSGSFAVVSTSTSAAGIFAQSIGGGGGDGGLGVGAVGIGGRGGAGGNGNTVTVENHGSINQNCGGFCEMAPAILAQSIGGGGGNGGGSVGIIGIGGSGGGGGTGGVVTVVSDNNAVLTTHGFFSQGILAQSIGGGGGNGGFSAGIISIGGDGAGGGISNAVTVTAQGEIHTYGANSEGILAQSIGGGGGNGGGSGGLGAIGGKGGAGVHGNVVTVNNSARITTEQNFSTGIMAQSIGGGGGNGGFALSVGVPLFGIGGDGGAGGEGRRVNVNNSGPITTNGDDAAAIVAQSIGGGGGRGAGSVNAGIFGGNGIGGKGGAGGIGGDVCVNANGACDGTNNPGSSIIVTTGERSSGIYAQSIGGGGGNGGYVVTGNVGIFGSGAFAMGGAGGAGGHAGTVFVGANGFITTGGANSHGIFAQAVGGSGGDGGFAIATTGGPTFASVGVALGGKGGAGNEGGVVTVYSTTNITTTGYLSNGIFAQSIGGGGGNGGFAVAATGGIGAAVSISMSGGGGVGADGKAVTVTSIGNIVTGAQFGTTGDSSNGILAQSIGGGGGNAGFAGSLAGAGMASVSLSFASSGGAGGKGGVVVVNNNNIATAGTNFIETWKANSSGIVAQSIGGSGGNGGFSLAAGGAGYGNVNLAMGGDGGLGSNSDTVTVRSFGRITTHGDKSDGIAAQSIGGGGGNGGFAIAAGGSGIASAVMTMGGAGADGANGANVRVESTGPISTGGLNSTGIIAQSIGGGGGNGGFSIAATGALYGAAALTFGGSGANGGHGADARIISLGAINTFQSQSAGLVAQSIGGGGGNGGFSIGASGAQNGALTVAMGGAGGAGGHAALASVDSTGDIWTRGAQSAGIIAQSLGGGGGNGGFAIGGTLTISNGASGTFTFGGNGGAGSFAGAAHVGSTGNIRTDGLGSAGIIAQSIGGGGGNGGFSGALALGNSSALAMSIAGNGGTCASPGVCNSGGAVDVRSDGNIDTSKDNSIGILAQSIGGGGGNGGFSITAAATLDDNAVGKGTAGSGGTGGTGGTVSVQSFGRIYTAGRQSAGIMAQSLGGGGGNGGFAIGAALSYSGSTDLNSVGGNGGSGNNSSKVTVYSQADVLFTGQSIVTIGDGSAGILAQSIGGGGGNGGFSIGASISAGSEAVNNTVGGSGANGGDSGVAGVLMVEVTNLGAIDTFGRNSSGIVAQSIGGGGGDGGFAVAAGVSVSSNEASTNAIGGGAGGGRTSGDVSVLNIGNITTRQDLSLGIIAQSIGGGGGNGGFAIAGSLSTNGAGTANSTGGAAGNGNAAGNVVVTSVGEIRTSGRAAGGILAQSIGGGGGNGGFAIGSGIGLGGDGKTNTTGGGGGLGSDAGTVEVNVNGSASRIVTTGDNSTALTAQSIGGGGGNGGFSIGAGFTTSDNSLSNSIGGTGGTGGIGRAVTVHNDAMIATSGLLSHGILAQSIGGGGGNGGFAISGSVSVGEDSTSNAVGGGAGNGQRAGNVSVTNTGVVSVGTLGARNGTIAILAQSIGGGGGNGGFSGSASVSSNNNAINNSTGGNGGTGGSAGTVTVTNSGNVFSNGNNGGGIVAQSIGGGGGNGGMSLGTAASSAKGVNQGVGGSGGSGGFSLQVEVNNNAGGAISTVGAFSHGIMAQSIGGGGGNGGFSIGAGLSLNGDAESNVGGGSSGAGNTGGVVIVRNNDTIQTDGLGAHGILAQSIGGGGGSGGFAIGTSLTASGASLNNSIGGKGAGGGDSRSVEVTNAARIDTFKDGSIGIVAQSIGGGGGNGAFGIGAAGSDADATNQSVGGGGGIAGTAENVTVRNNAGGIIVTRGAYSHGIEAQSIGGGGGNGAFAIGGAFTLSGDSKSEVGAGAGGSAGGAGVVSVFNLDTIATGGVGAMGIIAQSIGGGGGSGGFAISGAVTAGGASLTSALGGAGSGGGNGNTVRVENSGLIETLRASATGILAQSIGGGGGNGGFSIGAGVSQADSVTSTTGGSGGGGGIGLDVTVINFASGAILTNGAFAHGVQAQSIGGGGGNGGFAIDGTVNLGGDAKSTVGGGAGGGGGRSNLVNVENAGQIITNGPAAIGVFAQSVGGGGGSGGFAGAFSGGTGSVLSNVVGGAGAGAGIGGEVTVTNSGLIHTFGASSIGVLAQSIGGGGGNGAIAIGASAASGGGTSSAIGGLGGGGGEASKVTVNNSGSIITEGALSYGVYAQSIGGGGGNGGMSINGTLSGGNGGMVSNVGGAGGLGGAGGDVEVRNSGSIVVRGAASVGVLAQSIGGGGGSGGFAGALNLGGSGQMTNNIGGSGGNGGNGGNVTVISTGSIETIQDNSVSVLAQSIGGGGGNAAFSISAQTGSADGASVNVGGSSNGVGGTDGVVVVEISGGSILTRGALSFGMLAQSIGGGGGNGAISVPDPLSTLGGGITAIVGATGGISGDGNLLTTTNSNPTTTTGAGAIGLIGQSIGGGGGFDGVTGDISVGSNVGILAAIAGGSSTTGGSGRDVSFSNSGAVNTSGPNAIGNVVQSIGGGGGNAIFAIDVVTGTPLGIALTAGGSQGAIGNGANVSLPTFSAAVSTSGLLSTGLLAQSIGGGGGYAGFTTPAGIGVGANGLSFAVGGTGGAGGVGGNVVFTTGAPTFTSGAGAMGIQAQSIGGGGGVASFASGGTQAPAISSITLGGAGAGGNGGLVDLTTGASISTAGAGAVGVLAQSIGGGGGVATAFGVGTNPGVTFGATGAVGAGNTTRVTTTGQIATTGEGAHAIVAQSIGGGGGYAATFSTAGTSLNSSAGARGGIGSGAGGGVEVSTSAAIGTTGAGAYGIIAQSVGGGGGLAGVGEYSTVLGASAFAGTAGGVGAGGPVTVNVNGTIQTIGLNSTAILAASSGSAVNNINVNVGAVAVIGGDGNGHAVSLLGGATNTITNAGFLTTVQDINGMAVTGGTGNDNIVNNNFVIGSVDLAGGLNTFNNTLTGTFLSGTTVNLGPPGLLTNQGVMAPGNWFKVLTSNVTGSMVQTAPAIFGNDVDLFDQTADRINLTGTAGLAGRVWINLLNPGEALPGTHNVTIVRADGGVTNNGLAIDAETSAVITYALTYPNPNDVNLRYVIDFAPDGLTQNQNSVGETVNSIQTDRKSPAFKATAATLFYQPDVSTLGRAYDSISGEGVAGAVQASFSASDSFMTATNQQMHNWLNDSVEATSVYLGPMAYAPIANVNASLGRPSVLPTPPRTWRMWANGYSASTRLGSDAAIGTASLNVRGAGFTAGFDYLVDANAIVGFAAGAASSRFNVPGRQTTGAFESFHFATYGAYRAHNAYVTGTLGLSVFENRETRFAGIPGRTFRPLPGTGVIPAPLAGFAEWLNGEFDSRSFNGRLEGGYKYNIGWGASITPFIALQWSVLNTSAFGESQGNNPSQIGLNFLSRTNTSVPSFVGFQLDGKRAFDGGNIAAWARVSWVHEFTNRRTIEPEFIAAPGYSFIIDGARAARDSARINAGLKLSYDSKVEFFGAFDGDFSSNTRVLAGSGGMRFRW